MFRKSHYVGSACELMVLPQDELIVFVLHVCIFCSRAVMSVVSSKSTSPDGSCFWPHRLGFISCSDEARRGSKKNRARGKQNGKKRESDYFSD